MAKRFIDTGLFDDEWFSELPDEAKIFWIYYITKCDHAGFLKYNEKLIKFQSGIKDIPTVLQQFTNRIVRVGELLLFSPKFIDFQYPNFHESEFNAASSAKKIMIQNGIDPNSYRTVGQLLPNTYSIGIGNGKGISNGISKPEEKKIELSFHHKSDEFMQTWGILASGPKWKKKTQSALQASLKILSRYSESVAIGMMEKCIAGNWQGLVEPKNNYNGNTTNRNSPDLSLLGDNREPL